MYTATAVVNCVGGAQSAPLGTTFTTPAAPGPIPANDECGAATPLPVSTTCVPLTTTNLNATDSSPLQPTLAFPACSPYLGADVWFSVVVPANGIVQVTTGSVTGSVVTDTGLNLYTGTCGALTSIACNDNISATNLFSQVRATNLPAAARCTHGRGGATALRAGVHHLRHHGYYLPAGHQSGCDHPYTHLGYPHLHAARGQHGLRADLHAVGAPPKPRQLQLLRWRHRPAARHDLHGHAYRQLHGVSRGHGSHQLHHARCAQLPAPSAVYASNVGNTSAGIGFVLNAAASSYVVTYQAAGGPVQTVSPAPTASPVTLTGLVPGTSYTVCVASACTNGLASTSRCAPAFTTTGTAPTCIAPATATAASTGPTTASISFAPVAGVASYTVTYTAAGGTAQTLTPNPTASPVALAGLVPGVAYTVTVASNCAGGTPSLPVLATFATPLASRSGALADQLSLYPNPAHHSATLTVPAALLRQAAEMTLLNGVGQVVRRAAVPAGRADAQVSLDLVNLPAGLYLVQLATDAGSITKRLLLH